jgi:hypothetical protein
MMRLPAFVLSLLLLAGAIEPVQGWLIALTVLTGLAAVRFKAWAPWILRPALDFRMAALVLAVLLLVGTFDATRDWLIALSVVTASPLHTTIINLEHANSPGRGSGSTEREASP